MCKHCPFRLRLLNRPARSVFAKSGEPLAVAAAKVVALKFTPGPADGKPQMEMDTVGKEGVLAGAHLRTGSDGPASRQISGTALGSMPMPSRRL